MRKAIGKPMAFFDELRKSSSFFSVEKKEAKKSPNEKAGGGVSGTIRAQTAGTDRRERAIVLKAVEKKGREQGFFSMRFARYFFAGE